MPDIYMHSRLAMDVIAELNKEVDKDIVKVAAQGPDPLYYNVFSKQGNTYKEYADRLHDTDTRSLMIDLTRYTLQHLTKETYSYLIGFICHYALDTTVHPYVYYHVGIYDKNNPSTKQYQGLHLRFERSIDAQMIIDEQHIKPHKINLTKTYFTLKELPKEVNQMLGSVLNKKFDISNGEQLFKESVHAMYNVINRINTDRTGIKKAIYKIVDFVSKSDDMFLQDLSFFHRDLSYDFLNKQHRTWYHPITNQPFQSSVEELYDQGKNFAIDLITKVNMYLEGNKQIELKNIFTNLSFNSGVDCDINQPFQYFNNYTKQS